MRLLVFAQRAAPVKISIFENSFCDPKKRIMSGGFSQTLASLYVFAMGLSRAVFENGCKNFCAFVALSWRGIDGSLSMLGVAGFGSLFQNCYRCLFCQRTGRIKYLPVFLSEPWVEWCIGVPVGVSRSVKISEMRSVIFGLSFFRIYLRLVDWISLVKMGGGRWRRMLYGRLEYEWV